ncbi:MAG: sulfotransferase domain-containing protein [Phormidesmis sp.]
MRDPRDIVISGCFYHLDAAEDWLHVPRAGFGGLSYQDKMRSLPSLNERILFEMENQAYHTIKCIDSWNYQHQNFIEAKWEDLIEDKDLKLFEVMFKFLGFKEGVIDSLLEIAWRNSLFSNEIERNTLHVRSGKIGQWKTLYMPEHSARFKSLFGDILVRLGYEEDNEQWLRK